MCVYLVSSRYIYIYIDSGELISILLTHLVATLVTTQRVIVAGITNLCISYTNVTLIVTNLMLLYSSSIDCCVFLQGGQ